MPRPGLADLDEAKVEDRLAQLQQATDDRLEGQVGGDLVGIHAVLLRTDPACRSRARPRFAGLVPGICHEATGHGRVLDRGQLLERAEELAVEGEHALRRPGHLRLDPVVGPGRVAKEGRLPAAQLEDLLEQRAIRIHRAAGHLAAERFAQVAAG